MTAPHMPMMNGDELLECPFCGTCSRDVYLAEDGAGWFVICARCDATCGSYINKKHAQKAWNTRNGHLYTAQDFKDAAWERQNSDLIK